MNPLELIAAEVYSDAAVIEVIRPAAILPEAAARLVIAELAYRDVRAGGLWSSTPVLWQRFDAPDVPPPGTGCGALIGSLHVVYGTPTRYAITIFRATISTAGATAGWTVEALCDEALAFGGYTLADCPRADLTPPPKPFRPHG